MNITIHPGALSGSVAAIASKSMAHRMLICAALCPSATTISCGTTSADIDATASCLEALGASCAYDACAATFVVRPIPPGTDDARARMATPGAALDCGESGSTERFLLPIVGALGSGATLNGHGRLSERPLSPLADLLEQGGCTLSDASTLPLSISGRLRAGSYRIRGDVSSQFASGLLMAAPLLGSPFELVVGEPVASRPYVELTRRALSLFGVEVMAERDVADGSPVTRFLVSGSTPYRSPGTCAVEGDWSNAAFWLAAAAIGPAGSTVAMSGLDPSSAQGDRVICGALSKLGATVSRRAGQVAVSADHLEGTTIDCADIPDLVMPLAVVAALARGTSRLMGCSRLRLKESDRLAAVVDVCGRLGARCRLDGDDLALEGVDGFSPARIDSHGDHRIAMMAAIAATRATGPVTIEGAECVSKSYPRFFDDLDLLGGNITTREG